MNTTISKLILDILKNKRKLSEFYIISDMLIDEGMPIVANDMKYILNNGNLEINCKHYFMGGIILRYGLIPRTIIQRTEDNSNRRARKRRVNINYAKERVIYRSLFQEYPASYADNGGTVANRYRYPAYSQSVFAAAYCVVSDTEATIYSYLHTTELPANKITESGCAAAAGFRELHDFRYGPVKTEECRERLKAYLLSLSEIRERLATA